MNWNAVGAIGEVFGAIAVFVTLAYLAVQVRHAREETRRSARQSRNDWMGQHLLPMATNARLLDANLRAQRGMGAPRHPFIDALMEQSGVGEEEATMLFYWNMSWFNGLAQMVRDIDTVTAGERSAINRAVRSYFGMDSFGRLLYQTQLKPTIDQDLVRYIDDVLAQPA